MFDIPRWTKLSISAVIRYVLPVFTVAAVAVLTAFIGRQIQSSTPYLLFTLLLFLHTWIGGFKSGIFTTVLIATSVLFFFFTERDLTQVTATNITQTVIYVIQALVIVLITDMLTNSLRQIRATNKELLVSKRRLQEVIDSIFNLVIITSPDGKVIEANEAITTVAASLNVPFIGENLADTYPWAHKPQAQARLREAIDYAAGTGNRASYDDIVRLDEHELIDASISIVPIATDTGEVNYLSISLTDITDRKRYERELEQIEVNYSKLVNSNIVGMMIADIDGNILEANGAYLDTIGYTREELEAGKINWHQIVAPEYAITHTNTMLRMQEQGYAGPTQKEYMHKLGHRIPVLLSGVLIDSEEISYLCLVLDISQQKALETKKDEFISIASHELKTPLTSVKGYLQLLDSYLKQQRFADAAEFTGRINAQLDNLTSLINELLDISRIDSGIMPLHISTFSLTELITEVIHEIEPLASSHRIILHTDIDAQVAADRFRINQVITNLLTNAIKYSPHADQIDVYVEKLAESARISIQDYGIGIAAEKLEAVFEKFYRVDTTAQDFSQGMGLGLYIASEIMRRHKGEIYVQSTEGVGSVFCFTLPLANSTNA